MARVLAVLLFSATAQRIAVIDIPGTTILTHAHVDEERAAAARGARARRRQPLRVVPQGGRHHDRLVALPAARADRRGEVMTAAALIEVGKRIRCRDYLEGETRVPSARTVDVWRSKDSEYAATSVWVARCPHRASRRTSLNSSLNVHFTSLIGGRACTWASTCPRA